MDSSKIENCEARIEYLESEKFIDSAIHLLSHYLSLSIFIGQTGVHVVHVCRVWLKMSEIKRGQYRHFLREKESPCSPSHSSTIRRFIEQSSGY